MEAWELSLEQTETAASYKQLFSFQSSWNWDSVIIYVHIECRPPVYCMGSPVKLAILLTLVVRIAVIHMAIKSTKGWGWWDFGEEEDGRVLLMFLLGVERGGGRQSSVSAAAREVMKEGREWILTTASAGEEKVGPWNVAAALLLEQEEEGECKDRESHLLLQKGNLHSSSCPQVQEAIRFVFFLAEQSVKGTDFFFSCPLFIYL